MSSTTRWVAGALLALGSMAIAQAPPPAASATPDPTRLLPAPFAPGSAEQRREFAEVRAAIAAASPAERAQAAYDDAHEDPALFDATIAPGFALERLPLTWALLKDVQHQADADATRAKTLFHRAKPWGEDPRLIPCDPIGTRQPTRSYPSGHAMLGWSVGLVLADLLPTRAPAILDRAREYARERVVCGEHYPSDIEASHALAAIMVTRLLDQPAFQARLAVARVELEAAMTRGGGSLE